MSEEIQNHILQKYEVIKKIGSGAYGHVFKVRNRKTNEINALKKNFDAFQNSTDAQRTYRQVMFLNQFNHPNIISMQKLLPSQNDKDIYILFEYMDIDLFSLIRQNILGEKHKRYILYQVALALHYLHTADLIHRDIKPSNILVNENCLTKICDFGLIRSVDIDNAEQQPILTQYIATRWYRAPEILLGSKYYTKSIDIWSFGCLVGQVIKGKPLFPGNSTLNQIERVLTWTGTPNYSDIKSLRTNFGKQMVDLLSKVKPINMKQWLPQCSEDGFDLLKKTLEFNPQKRITMKQVIQHPYFKQFYYKRDIIQATQKIKVSIDDNCKLSLKDYRILLYKQMKQKMQSQSSVVLQINNKINITEAKSTKIKKRQRQTQGIIPSNSKDSKTISVKKKYDSLLGKRTQMSKTKYVKTQSKQQMNSQNKKLKESLVKFYWDKKKKSSSLYQQKRNSQVMGKYMYKHRYY